MRRENAGWVTWRSCAERLKLRVSARLTKSSSHLVSMADYCACSGGHRRALSREFALIDLKVTCREATEDDLIDALDQLQRGANRRDRDLRRKLDRVAIDARAN